MPLESGKSKSRSINKDRSEKSDDDEHKPSSSKSRKKSHSSKELIPIQYGKLLIDLKLSMRQHYEDICEALEKGCRIIIV